MKEKYMFPSCKYYNSSILFKLKLFLNISNIFEHPNIYQEPRKNKQTNADTQYSVNKNECYLATLDGNLSDFISLVDFRN